MSTTNDDEKELALIEQWETEMKDRKTAVLKRLGRDSEGVDVTDRHREQDANVALYDRMTPAELLEVYNTDRPRWERIMRAKEAAGLRKLFGQVR